MLVAWLETFPNVCTEDTKECVFNDRLYVNLAVWDLFIFSFDTFTMTFRGLLLPTFYTLDMFLQHIEISLYVHKHIQVSFTIA